MAAFRDYEFPLDRPVNYYLVEAGGARILVDTGTGKGLSSAGVTADFAILTHYHWDHSGGLIALAAGGGSTPRVCASRATIAALSKPEAVQEHMATVSRAVGLQPSPEERAFAEAMYRRYQAISIAAERVGIEELADCQSALGNRLDWLDCPGHSDDHVCLEIDGHLFVGDNIIGTPNVTLSNTYEYFESMTTALSRPGYRLLHPGHGPESLTRAEAASLVVETMRRKRRRLALVVAAVASHAGGWIGLDRVYNAVYPSPRDPLIAWVAARSLLGYVASLEGDGLVDVDRSTSPWRIRLRA